MPLGETRTRIDALTAALGEALGLPTPAARLHEVAEVLTETLNGDRCIINRVEGETAVAVAGVAPGIAGVPELARFPLTRGLSGRAVRECATQRVDDVLRDPDYLAAIALTRSEVVTPVLRDGVPRLVLNVESNRVGAFSAEDAEVLEAAAAWLAARLDLVDPGA